MSSQPCRTSLMQEKKMQKTDVMINDSVEDCDGSQLLYLLSHPIEIKGNVYTSQAGLYSEGFKVMIIWIVTEPFFPVGITMLFYNSTESF